MKATVSVALLVSAKSFEQFYGAVMNLTHMQYVHSYRHDWSFVYAYALETHGLNIFIYVPTWNFGDVHSIESRISIRFLPLARWYLPWKYLDLLSRTPLGRYVSEYLNAAAFQAAMTRALISDSIDVLYVQEYWTGRFDFLTHWLRMPIIGADHGGRKRRRLLFAKRAALKRAAAITCQTVDEAEEIRHYGVEPLMLANGVDSDFFIHSEHTVRSQSILIVARLTDDQKRISDLIRAIAMLPEPWTLKIVGTGPDEQELRLLSMALHLDQRVSFVGFVSDKAALRDMYQKCGVFCMPSANEGMPLAALEAMSCGCAVVVSNIRAFEKLIEEGTTGFKVPVGDITRLSQAIKLAWVDRKRVGDAARITILERHSLSRMAATLADLIQGVAERGLDEELPR